MECTFLKRVRCDVITCMQHLNPYKSKAALQLGTNAQIRTSAALFERAVATFLQLRNVPYETEREQKQQFKQQQHPGEKIPVTPDF